MNKPAPTSVSSSPQRSLRVGIIGAGQLARMLAESLGRYGATVSVLGPNAMDPAAQCLPRWIRNKNQSPASLSSDGATVEHGFVEASFHDLETLSWFVAQQDVVTYEWESIDCAALRNAAAASKTRVAPSLDILEMTRSRLAERAFIASLGLPCASFRKATDQGELEQGFAELGLPLVAKTDRGGYDGKGQWVLTHDKQWLEALPELVANLHRGNSILLERRIELLGEVSCIVARSAEGSVTFPVFDNRHRNQILATTDLPSSLGKDITQAARTMATRCAEACRLEGLLTVEFFWGREPTDTSPRLFINEFAPRPHNSGHVTRRATTLSQFDALAHCLLGLPLAEPGLLTLQGPWRYRMVNIMGEDFLAAQGRAHFAAQIARTEGPRLLEYFDYGKQDIRPGRKMGHYITLVPEDCP